jgi:AraC-like DNA-binding protein
MSELADRRKILRALHAWGASTAPRLPVVRVLAGQRPPGPPASFFMEAPRIILVLEGRATFLTVVDDAESRFDLVPGQLLFLAPYTWISPVPRESYRSLGITFRQDSTRLIITTRRPMRADGVVVDRHLAQWRTLETLGATGEHLLALMRGPTPRRLGEQMFTELAEMLIVEITGLAEDAPAHVRPGQTVMWQAVSDYLAEHWSDPQLSRKSTAAYFNRHPNHFSRFFHGHAQKNFRAYLNEIRLERSIRFLTDLRYNVSDVAVLCGFTEVPYFIQCFRQRYGITPGGYRRRHER